MMPNLQFGIIQQYQQGVNFAQQGMMAEQMGNGAAAAQCYDQAIAFIGNSIAGAVQSGLPVLDSAHFSYAFCNLSAARVKFAMGWPQAAPMHLAQAFQALQQAIAINPNFFQYHSTLGAVLLGQGNVPGAIQEFQRAVQLNPADGWSHWMLSSMYSAQGASAASNQYYAAAVQAQPNLPPPQQYAPAAAAAPGGAQGSKPERDWFGLAIAGLKFATSLVDASQKSGAPAQPSWPQFGWRG